MYVTGGLVKIQRARIILLFSSDAFIQAQHQIARWTSEEGGGGGGGLGGGSSMSIGGGVQHRPPQQPPPPPLQQQQQQQQLPTPSEGAAAPSASSSAAAAAVLAKMGHHVIHQLQLQQKQQQQQQQKLPAEKLPIKERGYYPSPPHTDNGLDDEDDDDDDDDDGDDDNDDDDDGDDDDDDNNDNLDYDKEIIKIHEAVNAQSHQDIKILNNNDKKNNARMRIKKNLLKNTEKLDETMTMREIDVNHLPNINKHPLDDKYSLECNIIMNNGGKKKKKKKKDIKSSIIAKTMTKKLKITKCPADGKVEHDNDDHDDDHDDDNGDHDELLSKNNTSNNTSDNENTALLPPSHFPEYKH